ncbi:hypothetical protein [Streptomyces ureilyticus]|uniref:Uncharacterized protein n=1 Tax=Streptomyces ureilyticus TaxID=1775131 RepID=A0ABX0DWU0_9ACTN|nr:hypothetical protein [Streptomyces ureilyticus]NGO46393.1 hypothetical protein [Streptomyces ureilyticus]
MLFQSSIVAVALISIRSSLFTNLETSTIVEVDAAPVSTGGVKGVELVHSVDKNLHSGDVVAGLSAA